MRHLFNNLKLWDHRRFYLGKSQKEIAAKCGMSRTNYSRIESGKISPTAKQICKIANALEIHPGALFTERFIKDSIFDKKDSKCACGAL